MRERLATVRYRLRLALIILALVLFVIFLLQNTGAVRVRFLVFDADIAGAIVILVTSLLGFVAGFFSALNMRRPLRDRQGGQKE
jgi:uncharacterized integral membrane protein